MRRTAIATELLDLSVWPTVAKRCLPADSGEAYRRREEAIRLYVKRIQIEEIEARTGIGRRQLYRLLERCVTAHPDGRIYGFRGLLPRTRTRQYQRRAPARRKRSAQAGLAGAFTQLLERHPELEKFLMRELTEHKVILEESKGRLTVRGLSVLHGRFLERCRALGLTGKDYPFTEEQRGIRSLSKAVKRIASSTFERAARASGAAHIKGAWPAADYESCPVARVPYEAVEFDGHRIDARLKLLDRDPFGFEQVFELERVWLLVVVDVCSRAVLGYHVVLAREYNRHDVLRAIEKAIEPHRARQFTVPGLKYGRGAGFPSGKFPELAYGCWDWFRFDNARAHLAEDTLKVICEELGCIADAGPYHDPDERPFVERFFGTLCGSLSHRLPGTTGSNPRDVRRKLSDPNGDLRLVVTLAELEDLIEAVIANYNAAPHAGLGGRSPLEAIEYFVRGKHSPVRWLPEPMRRNFCLLQSAHTCVVRGSLARGIRPHINFYGVRYANERLSRLPKFLGKRLSVFYNAEDLRTLRAYLPDGSELGVLTAARPWNTSPHSLRLRRTILKLKRQKQLRLNNVDDPVEIYAEYQRKHAGKRRRAASDLAEAHRQLKNRGSTPRTPAGRRSTNKRAAAMTKTPLQPTPLTGPVKPKKLSIRSGFSR